MKKHVVYWWLRLPLPSFIEVSKLDSKESSKAIPGVRRRKQQSRDVNVDPTNSSVHTHSYVLYFYNFCRNHVDKEIHEINNGLSRVLRMKTLQKLNVEDWMIWQVNDWIQK